MADDRTFKVILPIVLAIGAGALVLAVMALVQSNEHAQIVGGLPTNTVSTNISNGEAFVSGARLKNNTQLIVDWSPTGFQCTKVFINGHPNQTAASRPLKLTVTNGAVVSGTSEVVCSPNGTIRLLLAGNTSNGSIAGRGLKYNLTYTSPFWDASYNTSLNVGIGMTQFSSNYTLLFTLGVLVILMGVLLAYAFGGRMGEGGTVESGGKFNVSNPMNYFEK